MIIITDYTYEMSTVIIIIVLISTFIHALWNFSIKKSEYPFEFLQLLAVGSGLIAFPFGLYLFVNEKFSFYGILLAIISGLIHVFYFYALGKAYEKGELSIVYPIARGTAVALVPIIGILIIGENIGLISIFGIIIVFIGIIILGGKSLFIVTNKKNDTILAIFVGLTITCYTIIDKLAVSFINPLFVFSISSFIGGFIPIMIIDRRINHFKHLIKLNYKFIFFISMCSTLAYPMILYAYKLSSVSLVAPLREIATVHASILGIIILKESVSKNKIIGIISIILGAIFIVL